MPPLEILLLCDLESRQADNIREHVETLIHFSRHRVRTLSTPAGLPRGLDFAPFDVVILHYSLFPLYQPDLTLPPWVRQRIAAFPGLKAAFMQDEYCMVNRAMAQMREMGISLLFSCAPARSLDRMYPPGQLPGVRKVSVLCGYVNQELVAMTVPPLRERSLDVVYRARDLPYWLGAKAQEKSVIAKRFLQDAPAHGLHCDISTRIEDRIYGNAWIRFMTRAKATLGVESGASVIDFTGAIEARVRAHLAQHPETTFEQARALYFAAEDGAIDYSILPPRHMEAAALRTLMILYEAEYEGLLIPGRHFVPLRRDHGNMADVVAFLRDEERAQEMVEAAYQEIARNPDLHWAAMARLVDREIDAAMMGGITRTRPPTSDWAFGLIRARNRMRLLPYRLRNAMSAETSARIVRFKRNMGLTM